ncbi:MAG: TSUP family transporter, partial [Ornithinibacter sp.]
MAALTNALTGIPVEAVAVLAVALGGLAQSATGMGFSLVAAPALILVVGPRDGVATVLALAVLASVLPLTRDWRNSRPREASRLLVPTLLLT